MYTLQYVQAAPNPDYVFDCKHSDNVFIRENEISEIFTTLYHQTRDKHTVVIKLASNVATHKHLRYVLYLAVEPFLLCKKPKKLVITTDTYNSIIEKDINTLNKMQEARLLSMLPGNLGTPARMAHEVRNIFKGCKRTRITVMNHNTLKQKGFGLMLTVGDSAINKPCFVVVERKAAKHGPHTKTVCIAGKGITFDSGGLALKPVAHMLGMKFDKIGAVYAAYSMRELLNDASLDNHTIIALLPFAENAVSAQAVRPGDVVKSYSGKTVEITNPDAEGRLILADALCYACEHYKPDLIIDVATLTGNARTVNCFQTAYFYSSSVSLERTIESIGDSLGERMNPMPRWTEYAERLSSTVADIKSVSGSLRCDSFMAMVFMREFVHGKCDWVHFDLSDGFIGDIPTGRGLRAIVEIVKTYLTKK